MHNDRHVVKMIVETAQLLSTAHHLAGLDLDLTELYKQTHINHPCSKWARESIDNYVWLCDLGMELCYEYTFRYGKIHKTQEMLQVLRDFRPNLRNVGLTPWALAMPDYCKHFGLAVESYRKYYVMEKQHLAKWKNREVPFWFTFS
jgi:hypothetical protein